MHIQTYLNQFSSIQSKERRKMENIFINLNKSRKSLSKLYDQPQTPSQQSSIHLFKKYKSNKKQQFAFDDNLFHPLYKSNLRLSHQRNNTISGKIDISKLSFKLNYVQNHRPIIKQKIINKAKEKQDSFNVNFLTQPKTTLNIDTKKSKIQKFIVKNKDPQQLQTFKRTKNNNKLSVKDALATLNNQKKDKVQKEFQKVINRYQTMPVRKIKSSINHYDVNNINKGTPRNRYYSPEKIKQKALLQTQLPDYAKNIMKPCKIQGIELANRPAPNGFKNRNTSFAQKTQKIIKQRTKTKVFEDKIQWSVRVVKTARQGGRLKKQKLISPHLFEQENSINNIRLDKKQLNLQPWNNEINNQQEQQHQFMFIHH